MSLSGDSCTKTASATVGCILAAPPVELSLVGSTTGSASASVSPFGVAGSPYSVNVGVGHACETVWVWTNSTPVLVSRAVVSGEGTASITLTMYLGVANHKVVVQVSSRASRYETAIQVSKQFASGVPEVFVASRTNFHDALAGAALAGRFGAPLYITSPGCVPASIRDSINPSSPSKKAVLGGTAIVSHGAASNTGCTSATGATPPSTPTVNPRYPFCKDLPPGYGPYYKGTEPDYYWY